MTEQTAPEPDDPKGLIRESYRICGVTAADCRSIFLDWALSLPEGRRPDAAIPALLARYGQPGHPMTAVLTEALGRPGRRGRRGGSSGRGDRTET
jgi:hypothetical protein